MKDFLAFRNTDLLSVLREEARCAIVEESANVVVSVKELEPQSEGERSLWFERCSKSEQPKIEKSPKKRGIFQLLHTLVEKMQKLRLS